MARTIQHRFSKEDRVRVASAHPWMPDRDGTIKQVETRIGNRFVVKFDSDELGLWHDEDGDPVLRLGEDDLILTEESHRLAA